MDINWIWVFDIFEINNKRFNAKRVVVKFMKAHITLVWPDRHRSWVITLPTSQISSHAHVIQFSKPCELLYIDKVVELTKIFNFFAIRIVIKNLLIICPNVTISFFPHVIDWRSTLENPYLSPLTSNWAIKSQYEKIKKSCNNFVHSAKHNSHNRVPKIGLKHNCAQLQSILRSINKTVITFSTQLIMMWFRSNLKDNALIYFPTKNQKFVMGQTALA